MTEITTCKILTLSEEKVQSTNLPVFISSALQKDRNIFIYSVYATDLDKICYKSLVNTTHVCCNRISMS